MTAVLEQVRPLEDFLVMTDEEMALQIEAARETLGPRVVILGHHYQRDDVIRHADLTGDSYQLSSSTTISFTTVPFTRLSIAQARFGGAMRYIVAHMHRSGASRWISLSGNLCWRRFTRFTSVPIAHFDPLGEFSTVLMMKLVDPSRSLISTT